jgi:Matrixin/Putative peptidoglycan binding domain
LEAQHRTFQTTKEKEQNMSKTTTAKKHRIVQSGLAAGSKGVGVDDLRTYLSQFGYLRAESSTVARGYDSEVEDAVRTYQAFHHLPVTGVVDDVTAARMAEPRCGNPDIVPMNAKDSAAFVLSGGQWANHDLRYAFAQNSPDLSMADVRHAVHQAFSTWSGYADLSFREVPLSAGPEIVISFETGDHGDGSPFDGPGSVLAHAFFPGSSTLPPDPIRGDTHFDDAEVWTIQVPPGASRFDLTTVAIHEFGHALGLRHSPVVGAVMEPTYAGPRRQLHSDDIQGMATLYGGPKLTYASWIHGTTGVVENPERLTLQQPLGWGLRIKGKPSSSTWVHFAIPTPVITDGDRNAIGPCILRMRTGGSAAVVRDVHIYDGETRVAAHDGVRLSGDIPFAKFGVAHAPEVRWGVGISIGVEFGTSSSTDGLMIEFFSAGCDFKD